jgi:hypothetical protein
MAVYGPDDVGFILWGAFNLLGDTVEITSKVTAVLDGSHSLGDSWQEFASVGLRRAEVTQKGYFNDASDQMNAALVSSQGTSAVFSYGLEGNTVGKRFVGGAGAMLAEYERIASLEQLHRANAAYRGTGQFDTGVILHALGARTSDGNSEGADSVDNTASSAGGGVAYLHVVAYSGFTDVVFKVRHSADDITYADLVTFSTVTAVGAERVTTGVTVNRHLAVDWNVTGSGSVTFLVGFKRNA